MLCNIRLIVLIALLAVSDGVLFARRIPLTLETSPRLHTTWLFTLRDGERVQLTGLFNAATGAPVHVRGGLKDERLPDTSIPALLNFVDAHPAYFQLPASELEVTSAGTVRGRAWLNARQLIEDRPVIGSRVMLRVGRSGRVVAWGADVVTGETPRWQAAVSPDEAIEALRATAEVRKVELIALKEVWIRDRTELIPAYQITLMENTGVRRPTGLIDARTGMVLSAEDGVYHATITGTLSGPVIPWNPSTPAEIQPLGHASIRVGANAETSTDAMGAFQLTDLPDGNNRVEFWLEGLCVSVQDTQLELMGDISGCVRPVHVDSVCVAPGEVSLVMDPETMDLSAAAVNTFWHVVRVHDWWAERDPGLDLLAQPIRIYPDQTDDFFLDNAGFIPRMPPWLPVPLAVFGAGGPGHNNFAHLSDVIYHEYNHGITAQFYPVDGQVTDMESAMHEGFSDYYACVLTDTPYVGIGLEQSNPDGYIRSLRNDLVYPEDWQGEGHFDGQILSAALWEARDVLGGQLVDTLFHFARYSAPEDLDEYYTEVLLVDDDNDDLEDGTPHQPQLYAAFHRHGIGPDEPDAVDPEGPLAALPEKPALTGLYPNPFNPATTIHYALPAAAPVTFTVHDVLGREVERVSLPLVTAGTHTLRLDLAAQASGVYFVRLQSGPHVQTAKAVLMK